VSPTLLNHHTLHQYHSKLDIVDVNTSQKLRSLFLELLDNCQVLPNLLQHVRQDKADAASVDANNCFHSGYHFS